MTRESHTPAWIGHLGRLIFSINAKTRESAIEAAREHAGDFYYETEQTLSEYDPWPLGARAEPETSISPEALEGGAWQVQVARIGHSSVGRDSDFDSDYIVESAQFVSPMPHGSPHASDDDEFWPLRRKAILEREAIDATLDQTSAATRSTSPPRI